ncbi:MAG: hypothetical protein ACE5FJ_03725 [Gemmatimonadales bacterium]
MDWFNQIDTGYRTELRDMNELNYRRFEATLEGRLAEHDARIERRFAEADVKLAQTKNELIRWMFGFWVGTVVSVAGIVGAMLKLTLG